ncbi:hypothetical protein CTI12_AA532590 [Artemisia annua]|uniref:Uncharacterized protein n=1 Tax=Artemisia annua TaxID=35608 RepID=A0A2U1L425_ARTAN|nr:hypothetical protein CTI12_AA532590 [Artemisia annua]
MVTMRLNKAPIRSISLLLVHGDEDQSIVVPAFVSANFAHEAAPTFGGEFAWGMAAYVLLAIGLSLLFWAPVASKCLPSDYSSDTVRILAVRAIALTFIFQSSKDTLFAMVAVVTCLTVYILTRFIK